MDEEGERRPKRQKRESSYRAKALEKFKQLKSGERKKYEVEEVENVYDTVDEKEYTKKVLSRQDDDWIVDDDGSGYVEDGRDIFDDDLDRDSIAAASSTSKNKGVKRKKRVAENAGRGNLQEMLSKMPQKKKEVKKLDEDETLAELLQELNETPKTTPHKPTKTPSNFSPLSVKQAERDYMRQLKKPSITLTKTPNAQKILKKVENTPTRKIEMLESPKNPFKKNHSPEPAVIEEKPPTITKPVMRKEQCTPTIQNDEIMEEEPLPEPVNQACFDDDLDMSLVDVPEEVQEQEEPVDKSDMLKDWIGSAGTDVEMTVESDVVNGAENKNNAFRFFWWDAYEDVNRQPGVVFLFGKTYQEDKKSYVSCCVAVRNIERRVFFLPRSTEEKTGKVVTPQDIYSEINDSIMKGMHIKCFKARSIQKKYAFDHTIPVESDYMEVRYSAKDPPVSKSTEGRTFSKVFGTETSFLEILLLDRRIKGPCWLDIANPVKVTNPISWCQVEIDCNKVNDISIVRELTHRPPLVVASINMRRTVNPQVGTNEIVMLSCVSNAYYSLDKQAPTQNFFQKHFCVFTGPGQQVLPFDLHANIQNYKATTLQKLQTEKAVLNYFISQIANLDPDLIVGHDLQGYQINVLSERLVHHQINSFSRLGRLKKSILMRQKVERELFLGRLVCDIKISAKELIRSRSYDLDSLCQAVLKMSDGERIDLEPEEVIKMFQTTNDIFKLVALTMQDSAYIIRIMYALNIIPLALQITNIAGNVMSKTLMGGRSERNEFLLLHAFTEKGYIPPDKTFVRKTDKTTNRKKPTYSGGLVLDPKIGFYDKLILLMDFNSLYPSIIQEYNICFTTMPPELSEENMVLPSRSLPAGVLPTEIRKLVESRRDVKKLMNNTDLSDDQRQQYHIRQMALKLTANSMYGCLGFSNSRFYAKNLAALVTHKGREILTDTKEIVQKMNFEVIYGDTDSLMINTNIVDYDQVFQIGHKIKHEVNKFYRQVELDIDGVFKYLLLLKKKKYAAVTLAKTKTGDLKTETEYKGLDIVRRDWSRLASEAGKNVLNEILSEQSTDERVANVVSYLKKIREDLEAGKVPISLLVITKQLTKNPNLYNDVNAQPHVQVALRYNKESGGHFRAGDTVPYVICDDGSGKVATQRAYHIEELKNKENLKIDVSYYLAHQLHPVISRICEPLEELDAVQIAECLGMDTANIKKAKKAEDLPHENVAKAEVKFRDVEKFTFKCYACKTEICCDKPVPVLDRCANPQCKVRPVDYLPYIQNQLRLAINCYLEKYYRYEMYCEDPMCTNDTNVMPLTFSGRFPICNVCKNSVLFKKYTERDLYTQIEFFNYIFDLSKLSKKPVMEYKIVKAYKDLADIPKQKLAKSAYSMVNLGNIFARFAKIKKEVIDKKTAGRAKNEVFTIGGDTEQEEENEEC